ncbi:MAG: hypothetical protein J7L53_07605 [Deltaproteobacteria bacterium]|nr:hypothetical protein [Deltaproteobacteria bacterium]
MASKISNKKGSTASMIPKVEVGAIIALLIMWLCVWAIMTKGQTNYLSKIQTHQKKILILAKNSLFTQLSQTPEEIALEKFKDSWPFEDRFKFFIIKDGHLIASNSDKINTDEACIEKIFRAGDTHHTSEIIGVLNKDTDGAHWFEWDRISPPQWATWSVIKDGEGSFVLGIISDKKTMLRSFGFSRYRFMLMVCGGLFSALILLALIWARSWIRISSLHTSIDEKVNGNSKQ